ncbi:hypothetical protein GOP47_0020040 [Adiantum capillus-veneris]|uniref:Probable DNA helicase MCM9 n=1 Tax=Adiantum capillus-veneris TaxID=13818 RepID=A0A9D4UCG2_ADICA|nr:hypothetical protein GOP47_0020040 [Adiantum capillus-veneris]
MSDDQQKGTRPLLHDSDFLQACKDFLQQHHTQEIETIYFAEEDTVNYAIVIEYADLLDFKPWVAECLYFRPSKFLPLLDDAIRSVQDEIRTIYEKGKNSEDPEIPIKDFVHVRVNIHGSAAECPETQPSISKIRVKDIGRLITIKGTVIRSGAIKLLEGERLYECNKCKHRFKIYPDLETGNSLQQPTSCPSQRTKPCLGTSFHAVEGTTVCHDYQEIKIQENVHTLGVGSVPRSISVVLKDDLVDTVKAGDDIVVTGILFAKWRSLIKEVRCDLELMLLANFIRKANQFRSVDDIPEETLGQFQQFWSQYQQNPFKGRNTILQSICPQIYGLYTVKLAVSLTLIGGVQHIDASGTRIRGESHLLLVGDPGTGKSQFLKFAAKLSHRSVMTTGLGSTSAGLTVTAVKDGGEWMLEAGALVLADGGLCCIDEFDSIREPDRATIHEAMEQQTISVAKAGLVTTLNTRTTVFGVTNPKGTYDPYQPLTVNTTLSGPLLSRFDIVLVLLDTKNPDWDKIVSSHILEEHAKHEDRSRMNHSGGFWNLAILRRYIQYVKEHFQPALTTEAESVIVSYYQLQRRSGTQNASRITIRMLESLIRLAQAHARLMFRNKVTRADAIAAIFCVESSMTTSAILDNVGNALHSSFANNPDEEYAKQEKVILERLNLLSSNGNTMNHAVSLSAREKDLLQTSDSRRECSSNGAFGRGVSQVNAATSRPGFLRACTLQSRQAKQQQPLVSGTFTEEGLLHGSQQAEEEVT